MSDWSTAAVAKAFDEDERIATPGKPDVGAYDPATRIYPSEIGGCSRRATLRLLKYQAAPFDRDSQGRMASGLDWEKHIGLLWYARANVDMEVGRVVYQQPILTPYGIGKLDIWLPDIAHMVEAKSTTSDKIRYAPDRQYLDQVLFYMHFFGNKYEATAEIAYAIRDTREIVSFPVEYDQARVEQLIQWAREVGEAVRRKQPLEKPEGMMSDRFPCGWSTGRCQFWQHCWEERLVKTDDWMEKI